MGTKIMVKNVDAVNPPITALAMGAQISDETPPLVSYRRIQPLCATGYVQVHLVLAVRQDVQGNS